MWFRSLFRTSAHSSSAVRRRRACFRLQVECLEDRWLPSFAAPVNYAVGANPSAVATADFNHDGKLDLAVANAGSNSVSVLLGNGDGTFQAARSYATAAGPQSIAVADFNGDGKLDLVTAGTGGISLLPGNGDGTFQAPRIFVGAASYVTVADLNGDGKPDLVTLGNGGIGVALGNGDGTFRPGSAPDTTNWYVTSVAVGDFNGDGKLDLAAEMISQPDGYYNWMGVAAGNGDGTFQNFAGGTLQVNSPASMLAAADFNSDGKLDLVDSNGTVMLNQGNLNFAVNWVPGGSGNFVTVGDFNGDGKADVAFSSGHVLLGNGQGGFRGDWSAANGNGYGVGDFNGDGYADLAVTGTSANSVSVQINDRDWRSFKVTAPSTTTAGNPAPITVSALDNFGNPLLGYTGTVHFTSSDPQAVLPADYTFTAADKGTHTFDVILKTGQSAAVTVTDTATPAFTKTSFFTVNPAAATTFQVAGFPSPVTAGVSGPLSVTAFDRYGNVDTNYTGTVHFTSSDAHAVLPADYTFIPDDFGSNSYFFATMGTVGLQSITATDTVNPSLTGSQTGITVKAATASTITVTGFPLTTTAGVAGSFTVTARYADGTTDTAYAGTVVFSSSDRQAALPAAYTFTPADAGVHTFIATLKTAGTQSITAADTVTSALTSTESGITVNAAAASKFIISAPSSVSAGFAFSLTITVQDAYGNVVTGYAGTVHFSSTDNKATLPANYTFKAADNGVHTFTGVVLRTRGSQKITVTDTLNSSLTGSVTENVL